MIVTKLNKTWTKLVLWVYSKLDERLWKERMAAALAGADENKAYQHFLETALHNQMMTQRMHVSTGQVSFQSRAAQIARDDMVFKVATLALKDIWRVHGIVGVQPMLGPVSEVFRLAYNKVDREEGDPGEGKIVRLSVVKDPVQASSRRLRARWSLEATQDVQTLHDVDLAQEMITALAQIIADEVITELINDMYTLATKAGNVTVLPPALSEAPEFQFDHNVRIGVAINQAANTIGARTRRGPGNFVISSPLGVSLLQSIAGSAYSPVPSKSERTYTALTLVGYLNGSIAVYMSTAMPSSDVDMFIVGYKGSTSEIDAGLFYCPYVPVMTAGVMIDPGTFQPVLPFMTRYGKSIFTSSDNALGQSSDYFAVVSLGELPAVDQPEAVE